MKVLLVNPGLLTEECLFPGLGLAYIGASLKAAGHDVKVLEFSIPFEEQPRLSLSEFEARENAFYAQVEGMAAGFDAIGVGTTSFSYYRGLGVLEAAKNGNPGIATVLGGPHPTLAARSSRWSESVFVDSDAVDFVVAGEGENAVVELFEKLTRGSPVARLVQSEQTQDGMERLPFPAWELFAANRELKILPVQTARGCKFSCKFCDEKRLLGTYKRRNIESVVAEMRRDYEEFGVRAFWFSDSSLTSNPELALLAGRLREEFFDAGIPIAWSAFARADELKDEQLLRKMKESGCVALFLGIESGSDAVLNSMNKRTSAEEMRKAVQLCTKAGIAVSASFICGFPGETEKDAAETMALIEEFARLGCTISLHTYEPPFSVLEGEPALGEFSWRDVRGNLPPHLRAAVAEGREEFYVLMDRHAVAEGFESSAVTKIRAAELVIQAKKMVAELQGAQAMKDYEHFRRLLSVYGEKTAGEKAAVELAGRVTGEARRVCR